MTQSTDGQISYGVMFEEDHVFPWQDEKHDFDIEQWWLDVNNYKKPFKIYDDKGEKYFGGRKPSDATIREYYRHRDEFQKKHPLPVKLVNYCSGDYPMYIIAVENSIMTANRGHPIKLNDNLEVPEEDYNSLCDFLTTYLGIENPEPRWYLSSYWG